VSLNTRDCELTAVFHVPLSSRTKAGLSVLVKPDAADDLVGPITHIVIIVRPYSATAFAGLDWNKLI
jgi:hypothetical protein